VFSTNVVYMSRLKFVYCLRSAVLHYGFVFVHYSYQLNFFATPAVRFVFQYLTYIFYINKDCLNYIVYYSLFNFCQLMKDRSVDLRRHKGDKNYWYNLMIIIESSVLIIHRYELTDEPILKLFTCHFFEKSKIEL
jgi:hypothetical protein